NEKDDDCDGFIDDEDDSVDVSDGTVFYADADDDGYGDATVALTACVAPAGYRLNSNDCDDTSASVSPGAQEVCNDIDDDCDELVDDLDDSIDLSTAREWYADVDGDGYGDPAGVFTSCASPSGYVDTATDCDDGDATINPAGQEVCDPDDVDEDCDGLADNADDSADAAATGTVYYPDTDGDGFGDETDPGSAYCDDPSTSSETWLTERTDCNDSDAAIHPAATEVCDAANVDEDCDGLADDADDSVDTAATGTLYYPDADEDGYGDESDAGTAFCDNPSTSGDIRVTDNTDCDDSAGTVNPAATEVCDAADVDEDCDGTADDADSSVAVSTGALWYPDADADGYGDADDSGTLYCDDPSTSTETWLADNTDCDDGTDRVSPGAAEVCDGVDNDCDPATPEDGMAALDDGSGGWTDVTTSLAGSMSSPAAGPLSSTGTLYVCDGTWYWNMDLRSPDLTVIGVNGSGSTVLDGSAADTVLTVRPGAGVRLRGVTVKNGASAGDGGGVRVEGGTLIADDVVLEDNDALTRGGAISVDASGEARLSDCQLRNNTADRGAGGFTNDRGYLELDGCTVDGNVAASWGGGLEVYDDTELVVIDSTISDNEAADYGGGIECNEGGIISVSDASISDNLALGADGGGIDL
ncbi:MAG: MopE-related protein, partial [Myxococcota bacterium]|nr:MopE-related protein [Myxococcota bacterium]